DPSGGGRGLDGRRAASERFVERRERGPLQRLLLRLAPSAGRRWGARRGGPAAEQVQVGVRPPLEGIGVARLDARIVAIGIYQVRPLPRVVLREQAPDRLFRRERRVALVEVAVREREADRLAHRTRAP